MLNFLWWFAVGPVVGWLAGRMMRTSQNGWLDALAGLVGAILFGVIWELIGFNSAYSALEAILSGAAGALVVTLLFRKLIGARAGAVSAQAKSRAGSYTSYKSRMGK